MNKGAIINQIKRHKKLTHLDYKLKEGTQDFTNSLFYTLFDHNTDLEKNLTELEALFTELVRLACWQPEHTCTQLWEDYMNELPEILRQLHLDALAIHENDPASRSLEEVYLAYPGFFAIAIYRFSHFLYQRNFPIVPRLMTEYAHQLTGVDINPGAQIGEHFFIDHATGIVIGETAIIEDHVKLYQGVTLGALSVEKDMSTTKRHPTIETGATIYANATILGGKTTIGAHSIIGGNVWLTSSVPAYSLVSHQADIKIRELRKKA